MKSSWRGRTLVVQLRLTAGDITEDPAQPRLGPGPQDHPGVLLLMEDVELQQVAGDLPGEEDVDVVEGPEDVHALLECGGREEVGGDDVDLLPELVQADLQALPPHRVVGDGEDRDSALLQLLQVPG